VPAAAVIPAPIAYIKVVAVKKLVVEFRGSFGRVCLACLGGHFGSKGPVPLPGELVCPLLGWAREPGPLP
jgi:hypothetical protein